MAWQYSQRTGRLTRNNRALAVSAGLFISPVFGSQPDCTQKDAWPSAMTFVHLKNAGLADNNSIDFDKTTVSRLASEMKTKGIFHQIHLIKYFKKNGEVITTITANDASMEECSLSGVDVYLVDKILGDGVPQK